MDYENFEKKRSFVTGSLSRCVADMFPRVLRLEYSFRLDEESGEPVETVRIVYDCGYAAQVDVSGLNPFESAQEVLHELQIPEAM